MARAVGAGCASTRGRRPPRRAPTEAAADRADRRERDRCGGFTLVNLLVALTVVVIVGSVGLPELFRASARARLELGAAEVASTLRLTRLYALRHSANVAVKFRATSDDRVLYAIFRDGDGDGVRTKDLEDGTDPQVEPWRPLTHLGRGAGFGFPPGPLPPDPTTGRAIGGSRRDPIRFNLSDLASFSAGGGATPGSLYLTDGARGLAVVRVANLAGTVRALRWDRAAGAWRGI